MLEMRTPRSGGRMGGARMRRVETAEAMDRRGWSEVDSRRVETAEAMDRRGRSEVGTGVEAAEAMDRGGWSEVGSARM